jgi:hypothetical protein
MVDVATEELECYIALAKSSTKNNKGELGHCQDKGRN